MISDAERAKVVMLLDAGQPQEALDLTGILISADADDGVLCCLQSQAFLALQRPAEALEAANRAARLMPYSAEPHRLASVVLAGAGDLDGSAGAAREAVRLEATSSTAWEQVCYAVGALVSELGRSGDRKVLGRIRELADEVLAASDRVVSLAPTESSAFRARAYALACVRRPDLAKEALDRARALDPTPPDLQA